MSCNWSEMDGRNILNALEDPETLQNCEWDKISPFAWIVVLKAKPELVSKCDWSKLPAWNQMRILQEQPQLASFVVGH